MKIFVFLVVVSCTAAQLVHHRPIQIQLSDPNQQRPIQIQTPPIEVVPRPQPNFEDWSNQWQQPEQPIHREFPTWNWQHEQPVQNPVQPIQPFPEWDFPGPRLPPWVDRQQEGNFPELNVRPVPDQTQDQSSVIIDLPRWNINIPNLRPQPEPEQPVQRPQWPQPEPEPLPQWPQWREPEQPVQRPQWPIIRPQPEPEPLPQWPQWREPEQPVQRPQWPQPEPEPLPQWPNLRPQPNPPVQQPQFPHFPHFPQQPRANWREGRFNSDCPNPDNHAGEASILPGDGQWAFFICWGQTAFPFYCPPNTVFIQEVNVCADPAWQPSFRPFEGEEVAVSY